MKTLRSRCITRYAGYLAVPITSRQLARPALHACRQAVYRQRKAALVALVRVLAAAAANVTRFRS